MPWREDLHIQVGNSFKEFGDYRSAVRAYSAVTSGAHRSDALREMMDATHRAGSDILPYIINDGPNSGRGGAPSQTAPRPRLRDLPNRISIDEKDPRRWLGRLGRDDSRRSEEHTSELQSLMRISYAVFCLKKKKYENKNNVKHQH